MSIPPLVCSTPPPPDQCEDDNDTEDFDLHYNLSQDDDYDYGSFSTYSHFQSVQFGSKPLENTTEDNKTNNNINNSNSTRKDNEQKDSEIFQWTKASTDSKLDQDPSHQVEIKASNNEDHGFQNTASTDRELQDVEGKLEVHKEIFEEEPNVEDLNLTVEEEELSTSTSSNVKNEFYEDAHSDNFDSPDKDKPLHIPDITNSIKEISFDETMSPLGHTTLASTSKDNIQNPHKCEEEGQLGCEEKVQFDHVEMVEESCYSDMKINQDLEPTFDNSNIVATEIFKTVDSTASNMNNESDDEFQDIHDTHVPYENKKSSIDSCINPWEDNQPDSDFGAFEAHFDESERTEPPPFQSYEEKSAPVNKDEDLNIEDDDFGDFDEFKSSTHDTTNKEAILDPPSQIPVLDFQSTDSESQVLENINKIINTIFVEDIPVPETALEVKLESMLCETWGHLLETDVRQPYIVNWNRSSGQKTLLKALCIDSRNILFGPKWNSNMPKYATNLTTAPLQPQRQSTPPGPYHPDANSDKSSAKVPSAWTDPFTSDGQESCNKEDNAASQKRPTDFESTISSKPDKIYSSTLDIQPLRQISLPDTHIFTPTDSETPRSKTIHYDEPSVFLSPSSTEIDAKSAEISQLELTSNTDTKNEDDGDYSDFQDFKGSFDVNVSQSTPAHDLTSNSAAAPAPAKQVSATNPTYSIGILQPIKLEPTMPTLNWPSPGEVKETFDDFSEFASNTTWNIETQAPNNDAEKIQTITLDNSNTLKIDDMPSPKNSDSFDDDFDTFQSALPASEPAPMIPAFNNFNTVPESSSNQNISAHLTSNVEKNLDFSFSDIRTVKSDAISLTRPIDILKCSDPSVHQSSVESVPKAKEPIVKIPAPPLSGAHAPPPAVLQPVSAPQVQQNTTQILQPLSLESFSQINWPNPGINLQDLSRFNPVETLNSLKSDLSVSGNSKGASPVHNQKNSTHSQEDDIWGEFVSSKPKPQQALPKTASSLADDDEWTDFVSSPTVKPQNGLSTISLNVHTNLNMQKSTKAGKLTIQNNQALEIPTLNYITPKSSNHSSYNDRHFQNL